MSNEISKDAADKVEQLIEQYGSQEEAFLVVEKFIREFDGEYSFWYEVYALLHFNIKLNEESDR